MNDTSLDTKNSILRGLAVTGFIVILALIAWISVQLVDASPKAFSSLASLAEFIDQKKHSPNATPSDLFVTSNSRIINSGETVKISWTSPKIKGDHTFSYTCTNGVSLSILDQNNELHGVDCEKDYNIGTTENLSLVVESEKSRFEELNYKVVFLATNDTAPRAEGSSSLTIINSNIQDLLPTPPAEPEVKEEVVDKEVPVETEETVKPKPAPTNKQEFVYSIPVSNPNGQSDLSTRFMTTGRIVGNTFFPETLVQNESGAIQFEVKNYGTKTSDEWTYTISLPNGDEYISPKQSPLKPNERAVITVGFTTEKDSSHTLVVTIKVKNDKNTSDNQFSQKVSLLR